MHRDLVWVVETERVTIDVEPGHVWQTSNDPKAVWVIREIDERAMQQDIFRTVNWI